MRIAVAAEKDMVSAHFGHCDGFTVYEVEDGAIAGKEYIANPGHEPGVLPALLREAKVDLVIAGGMGERAQTLFNQNGIEVIVGAQGTCEDAINTYNKGELVSNSVFCKH